MTNVQQKLKRSLDLIKNKMKKMHKELSKHNNQSLLQHINHHHQQIHLNRDHLHHNHSSIDLVNKLIINDQAVVVDHQLLLVNSNKPTNIQRRSLHNHHQHNNTNHLLSLLLIKYLKIDHHQVKVLKG